MKLLLYHAISEISLFNQILLRAQSEIELKRNLSVSEKFIFKLKGNFL